MTARINSPTLATSSRPQLKVLVRSKHGSHTLHRRVCEMSWGGLVEAESAGWGVQESARLDDTHARIPFFSSSFFPLLSCRLLWWITQEKHELSSKMLLRKYGMSKRGE